MADEANFFLFNGFLFPTLFREDPRTIPLDRGSTTQCLVYSLTRVFFKRRLWDFRCGCLCAGGDFANVGINLASDAAFDAFKESRPDVAR